MLSRFDDDLWSSPQAAFSAELQALYPPNGEGPLYVNQGVLEVELAELQAVMGAAAPVEALRELRRRTHPGYYLEPEPVTEAELPPGLPAEFDRYLRGAIAWHGGDVEGAVAHWQAVLALPPLERSHRSVWAAYMIGRAQTDPAELSAWMARARALVADGFVDGLGLAEASYGWEAHHLFWQKQATIPAVHLYIQQIRAQDPTAVQSLRIVADHILEGGDLESAARDPDLARIVTLRLLARAGAERALPWLDAVEKAGTAELVGADQLAWASYQAGDMARAQRWLQKAPETAMRHWISARLAMRQGDIAAAEQHLAAAAEQLGPHTTWNVGWRNEEIFDGLKPAHQALAERGAVLVQAARYTEALNAFLQADHWLDAAYIAERILSLEELKDHVDTSLPASPENTAIRALLGRRLIREDRALDAPPYFGDAALQDAARRYGEALHRARQRKTPRLERATALWEAARVARWDGMEIMGAELTPDFAYTGGFYEGPAVDVFRLTGLAGQRYAPSADEQRRAAANTLPVQRYHYRYVATDLAQQAADLLPDDDTGTLKVLCQAGSWLKYSDPVAADVFYKSMVNRGWNNPLGNLANDLRWFPPSEACAMDALTLDHPEAVKDIGCSAAPAPRSAPSLGLLALTLVAGCRRRSVKGRR